MPVEMTSNEIVDLGLCGRVEILELVHCLEFDNVQTIRNHTIRLSLEQMFRFVCCDVRNSGENVCTMCGGTLNAVAVVDAALSSFVINVKVLEVVVEVNRASTEVSTEQGSMGGKDSCDVNVPFSAEGDGKTSLPFVEMRDDSLVELTVNILE